MQTLAAVFVTVLGVLIGSFLNACIYRLPLGVSVARGRSFCPHCREQIAWYDNIPVLSFIVLRARCRRCGGRISWRYPLVELLTGGLFLLSFLRYGADPMALAAAVFCCAAVITFFVDFEHMVIPEGPLAISIAVTLVARALAGGVPALVDAGAGLLVTELPVYLLTLTGGMGEGDVSFMRAAGLMLGLRLGIVGLLLGAILGGVYAVTLLIRKKAGLKSEIPLGPALAAGCVAALFCGEKLIAFIL